MLDILNCRAGDIKLTFDPANKKDVADAKKVIDDMLKAGYTLVLIEPDHEHPDDPKLAKHTPIQAFDATKGEYILKNVKKAGRKTGPRGSYAKRTPASGKRVTAVPRSGGG